MANAFVHVELHTTDVNQAKGFYGKLFDWKLEDVPMGDGTTYTMIRIGDGTGGGMVKSPAPGAPPSWLGERVGGGDRDGPIERRRRPTRCAVCDVAAEGDVIAAHGIATPASNSNRGFSELIFLGSLAF